MPYLHVVGFYRATPCASAVLAVGRCLSVSLSVTFVYCIQTAEDTVKLFWPRTTVLNSKGNPFSGGVKYTGWGKFAIFDGNRRLFRKWYVIVAMVAMER